MSSRLSASFAKGVANYVEKTAEKMPAIDRNQSVSIIFSGKCSVGGLMTDLGLMADWSSTFSLKVCYHTLVVMIPM
ncbi:MAG: hypothetical protein SPI30_10165 [Prevotella sp.]|nr:hypothetical protein [Prevotella sp.]